MSHYVVISLAANIDHKVNLRKARAHLCELLPECRFTRELWTEPVGTKHTNLYLNQLAAAHYDGDMNTLRRQLKQAETLMGRTPQDKLVGVVPIDLDLLRFDNERYHLKDWERDYVKSLLSEL